MGKIKNKPVTTNKESLYYFIQNMVGRGGPDQEEYKALNSWFSEVMSLLRQGLINRDDIKALWSAFGKVVTKETCIGHIMLKPYGYPGDFEIIDKIYTGWVSPKDDLYKWDLYFHSLEATEALRNRKDYFKHLLKKLENDLPVVLSVGCGPCREIYEYLNENPESSISFECIDRDIRAIDFSKKLIKSHQIIFHHTDAFRFRGRTVYNLIYSGGLFDYLNDRQFVFLLKKLINLITPGGELVIGNFSTNNPSKNHMEFGEWFLKYRNEEDLINLAKLIGCKHDDINIDNEPLGINMFLRIKKE